MKKCRIAFLALSVAFTSFNHSIAWGEDFNQARAELDQRQADLIRRLNQVGEIDSVHGQYVLIRDTAYYGANGVKALSERWHADASAWYRSWYEIIGTVQKAPSLAQLDIQEGIQNLLAKQQKDWVSLLQTAVKIGGRSENALNQLASLKRISPSSVPVYRAQIEFLYTQIRALENAIISSSGLYNPESLQRHIEILNITEAAVLTLLKKAFLSYPELQSTLSQVQELFRSERVVAPLLANANSSFNEVRDNVLAKKVFDGEESVKRLKLAVDEGIEGIKNAKIDPLYANPAVESLQKLLKAGQEMYANQISLIPKGILVKGHFLTEGSLLSEQCRDPEARKSINCELFGFVFATPADQIPGMTDEQLRYLERQIAKVKAGAVP